jgi:hypothetical protein
MVTSHGLLLIIPQAFSTFPTSHTKSILAKIIMSGPTRDPATGFARWLVIWINKSRSIAGSARQ